MRLLPITDYVELSLISSYYITHEAFGRSSIKTSQENCRSAASSCGISGDHHLILHNADEEGVLRHAVALEGRKNFC